MSGSEAYTLTEYAQNNHMIQDVLVPGVPQHLVPGLDPTCPLFSEPRRMLVINMLQMCKNMFDKNLCLQKVEADDILVVVAEACVTKFREGLIYVEASDVMIDHTLEMIGKIIENFVLANHSIVVDEIHDLLQLLKTKGSQHIDLIYEHPSLLEIPEKINGFIRAYDFLLGRVKSIFP